MTSKFVPKGTPKSLKTCSNLNLTNCSFLQFEDLFLPYFGPKQVEAIFAVALRWPWREPEMDGHWPVAGMAD